MANNSVRDDFTGSLSSNWTAHNWEVIDNALERNGWSSPDMLPDVAYYSEGIDRGDCVIKSLVHADSGAEIGLQVLSSASGESGYEFRLNRNNSPDAVEIWKLTAEGQTLLASASARVITGNWVSLKGKMQSLDYYHRSAGVKLSLYQDDEETAIITYSDRISPTPRGNSFIGVRARSAAGIAARVMSVSIRKLFRSEVPKDWEMEVWSWDRLADHALHRLERGANPQVQRTLMLEYLAFAEQELAMKCQQPWWLDRTYELTTSSVLNDLPAWIGVVKGATIAGQSHPIMMSNKAKFNLFDPGRTATGTVIKQMIFMGMSDSGEMTYALSPTPSGSVTITLYVKARPGTISDSAQCPLVPPEHAEALIFGALRRALRDDVSSPAVRDNETLWKEARDAIIRDNNKRTKQGGGITSDRQRRKSGFRAPYEYMDPDVIRGR